MTSPTGIPFLDELVTEVATEVETVARLARLGDFGTAGPDNSPSVAFLLPPSSRWSDGWWVDAQQRKAHPGRVGGPIVPWSTVVHTTDMLAGEWAALLAAWTTRPADGACAHFLIGRDEAHGVVQLAPINRNANHAGGPPGHGVFDTAAAKAIHPNLVCVGIELHCAGGVRQVGGSWRLVEGGVAHGAPIPDGEVIPDPQRPGRGWHAVTEYQYERLFALLDDLELVLAPMPAGATTRAFGEVPAPLAVMPTARVVTHAQLDPVHRADPWAPTCERLRQRSG